MKEALKYIVEEFQRRYRDGEEQVFVADDHWEWLLQQNASQPLTPDRAKSVESTTPVATKSVESTIPVATKPVESTTPVATKPVEIKIKPPVPPQIKLTPTGTAAERLLQLRQQLLSCTESQTHIKPGEQLVFGDGNPQADIFFVGDAPNAEEAKCGKPLVGSSGELFDKMILTMGLHRQSVYVAHIVTWRPGNKDSAGSCPPTVEAMHFCLPYLRAQIEIVAPKVIVALGIHAVTGLLGADNKQRITEMRGQWHTFAEVPLIISFHPNYLVEHGSKRTKRLAWEDMLAVMKRLNIPISKRQETYFLT
jgi:uracil-DNA glycosylase family 4